MRVAVEKWIFLVLASEKELFFEKAQILGLIEFCSPEKRKSAELQDPSVVELLEGLKILKNLPQASFCEISLPEEQALEEIKTCYKDLQSQKESLKILEAEQKRLDPFGDFSKSALENLSYAVGFSLSLVTFSPKAEVPPLSLIEIERFASKGYGLWISSKPFCKGVEPFFFEKDRFELLQQASVLSQEIEKKEKRLLELKSYESLLKELLCRRIDRFRREWSGECSREIAEGTLFYVEGWLPSDQVEAMQQAFASVSIWAQPIALEPQEEVPTCLKNNAWGRIGQDLVDLYDVPAATDKDPSLWVLGFFVLFFSMIIADGGYGALILLFLLWIHFSIPSWKGLALRMKRLGFLLAIGSIFWGFVTASFFSLSLCPSHPLRRYSPLHQLSLKKILYHASLQDETYKEWVVQMPKLASIDRKKAQQIAEQGISPANGSFLLLDQLKETLLKEFSLFIGLLHLASSLGRYAKRNWPSCGWILFLIGSWLYFPSFVKASTFVQYLFWLDPGTSVAIGLYLLSTGIATSLLLSLVQNKIYGLFEVMNLLQIFSDVLSYLRLYALGLAGSIMSATFNQLAYENGPIFGFFILLGGHFVNLVLGVMGGVIHGLRLNFLEWYHYSFIGGGRWLRPLKKTKESSL